MYFVRVVRAGGGGVDPPPPDPLPGPEPLLPPEPPPLPDPPPQPHRVTSSRIAMYQAEILVETATHATLRAKPSGLFMGSVPQYRGLPKSSQSRTGVLL